MEPRDLPSGIPTGAAVKVDIPPTPAPSFSPPDSPVKSVYHEPLVPNLSLLPTFVNLDYPSPDPQPYPAEVSREYFVAKVLGTYDVHPGRFAYQSMTIHVASVDGGSNQFLHGRMNLVIFPTVSGEPEPLSGTVAFVPQNYLQGAGLPIFDLTPATPGEATGQSTESGAPEPVGKGLSLPTHLHWFFDPSSGGSYTAPTGFTQGGGYLDIDWLPAKTPEKGSLASGRAIVLFQGLINLSSVLNSIEPSTLAQ